MGRIQSDVGLITGINIADTVTQLMQLAAKPREYLTQRTDVLKKEQVAVTELSALLMAARYIGDNLGKASVFDSLKATSGNDAALGVTITGAPTAGTSYYTPFRVAQPDQLLSSGVRTESELLAGGKFTFRFGDHVQRAADLGLLQGGEGFVRGKIRIADRSGASAEVDLTKAQTIDDVIDAINNTGSINVLAEAHGDHIRLIDKSGQGAGSGGYLWVREVGLGTTAASLGLAGIDTTASAADGQDLLWLTAETGLDALNDGSGVSVNEVMPDVAFTLRDGTTGNIDFSPIAAGSSRVDAEATLGDILNVINQASPDKLRAELSADGKRIVVTDLTQGAGAFALSSLYQSKALNDLGLDGAAVDGRIDGRRLLGGLKSVLLSSLGGGNGLGRLGALELTDRTGTHNTVDLSRAETLDDVVDAVNAAGLGIVAKANAAKNGLQLTDVTGATAGNLIVADTDGSGTAANLHLAVDAAVDSVNSGDLHLQTVGESTLLAKLNGGRGVVHDVVTFYDSAGRKGDVDFARTNMNTVGDAIQAINRLGLQIDARINDTGDGILLEDTAGGASLMRVADDGSGAAADLGLNRVAVRTTDDGRSVQTIDGSMTYVIDLAPGATLAELRNKITALKVGVTAKLTQDSSVRPYHLAISSDRTGAAARLVVDSSALGIGFQQISRASDALLVMGSASGNGTGILLASPNNTFEDAVPGLQLEIKQASSAPVAVTVSRNDANIVVNVKTLVDNYNKFREKLVEDTKYDAATDTRGVLGGDSAALRLDTDLSRFLSGRIFGAGSIHTIAELGISINSDGALELDEDKLRQVCAAKPDAVKEFFTKEKTGFSARFQELTDRLGAEEHSAIAGRLQALEKNISDNEARIEFMTKRLDAQRERMLTQFYNMDIAIGKIKNSMVAIQSIDPMLFYNSSSNSNG
jgi:flagellar hook-associated protein 2